MVDGWYKEDTDYLFSAEGLVPLTETFDLSPLSAEGRVAIRQLFALAGIEQ